MRKLSFLLIVISAISIAYALPARGDWAENGSPFAVQPGTPGAIAGAPDGSGGTLAAWSNNSDGFESVCVQRIDHAGRTLWPEPAVTVGTAVFSREPVITADGTGGAIVAWGAFSTTFRLLAQRVDADGNIMWTAGGVVVSDETGANVLAVDEVSIVADGAGGAIIAWSGAPSGFPDIRAQRLDADGNALWMAGGVPICTAADGQSNPNMFADGSGGAIVAWQDHRSGTQYDVYAQHFDSAGTSLWTTDGVGVCTAAANQRRPLIVPDDAGGCVIAWYDDRNGYSQQDLYLQRIAPDGHRLWTTDGVAVCTLTDASSSDFLIAGDGDGGAILAWYDTRTQPDASVFMQSVDRYGQTRWTTDGVQATYASHPVSPVGMHPDGSGGVILCYLQFRDEPLSPDVYAVRIKANGYSAWMSSRALMSGPWPSVAEAFVADGQGGFVALVEDGRMNWGTGDPELFAQRIDLNGYWGDVAPRIRTVTDVPGDQGGAVYLGWDASRLDNTVDDLITEYTIWRAIAPGKAALLLQSGAGLVSAGQTDPADTAFPVVRLESSASGVVYWELVATAPAYYLPAYGRPVATLFDLSPTCDDYHYFQVIAHMGNPTVFWASLPDSGRSSDNLAPTPPKNLAGAASFAPAGVNLSWAANPENDLGSYRLYRGTTADFAPGPATLVAATPDTTAFDAAWPSGTPCWYKLTAIDVHGNESAFAVLEPQQLSEAGNDVPRASYLAQNFPNPFNPSTTIAFGLARPGHARVRVYDVAGRLVATLVDEVCAAGAHSVVWDGTGSDGHRVASGAYICRFEADGFRAVRRIMLLK